MSNQQRVIVAVVLGLASLGGHASSSKKLQTPVQGVVCDVYFCADASGVSTTLTEKYLGKKQGDKLMAQGEFDRTVFTFANGVNCDTHARVCRKDRYRGGDGQPTGAVDPLTTLQLFGH